MTVAAQQGAQLRIGFLIDTEGPLRPWDARLLRQIGEDTLFNRGTVLVAGRAHVARMPAPELAGIERVNLKDANKVPALDVVLNFSAREAQPSNLQATRYGIWSLEHAGQLLGRGDEAAYRDSFRKRPGIAIDLVARGGAAGTARTIARAVFNRDAYIKDQQSAACEKAVALLAVELKRLAITGQLPNELVASNAIALSHSPLALMRHNASRLGPVMDKATKRARVAAGQRPLMWSLFVGQGMPGVSTMRDAIELKPAKGEFWADPFLFNRRGKTYVFFENYVYAEKRGKISVGVLNGTKFDVLGDVLDLGCHLSYPFIFEHGGDIFLMPEMSARRRVEIYRAVNFPLTWTLHASGLHGRSVADPVLFEDRGQWWLFANISETPFEDHCNELHAFIVDGPALRSITPHPLNPIVIGADSARNGGRIVRQGERLLRYAQHNMDGIYGRGLQVMDITRLDRDGYEEQLVESIAHTVKPGLIGIHHFDQCGDRFIFDGCRKFG